MSDLPQAGRCFRCGKTIELKARIGRQESCPYCRCDLHVCKNCRFYSPGAYNDCREPQAERVLDKEKANFCDFFSFRANEGKEESKEKEARKRLEDLFRPRRS